MGAQINNLLDWFLLKRYIGTRRQFLNGVCSIDVYALMLMLAGTSN